MGMETRNEYFYYDSENEYSLDEFLEYANMPENQCARLELIDGYIVAMAGNASFNHQRIGGYLLRKIGNYLEGGICEAVHVTNVYLYNESIGKCRNVFQPDIMIGCEKDKMTNRGYEGTPELIIEIVSKSTARNDYVTKLNRYMEFGVKEYWIVDYENNKILVCLHNGDNPPKISEHTFAECVKVNIFEGLTIDFKEISAAAN